jgi:hypothetical protein
VFSPERSFGDFAGGAKDFMSFSRSTDFMEVVDTFQQILERVGIQPGPINTFFPKLRFYLRAEIPR